MCNNGLTALLAAGSCCNGVFYTAGWFLKFIWIYGWKKQRIEKTSTIDFDRVAISNTGNLSGSDMKRSSTRNHTYTHDIHTCCLPSPNHVFKKKHTCKQIFTKSSQQDIYKSTTNKKTHINPSYPYFGKLQPEIFGAFFRMGKFP